MTQSGLRNQSPQLEAVKAQRLTSELVKGNSRVQGMIHAGDWQEVCDLALPVSESTGVGLGALS